MSEQANVHLFGLFFLVISFLDRVPPTQMFKNGLQEYAQKKSLSLPVYHIVNDGSDHLPQFKCSVTINGKKYESPPGFSHKKEAQNVAAKEDVADLQRQGFKFKVSFTSTQMLKTIFKSFFL